MALCLPAGAVQASTAELQGTWALEMHIVSAASVPVIGDVRSTTVTYSLMETVSGEDGWTQHYSVCDVVLTGQTRLMRSSLSQAFIDALPERSVHPVLNDGAYQVDLGEVSLGFDPGLSAGHTPQQASDPAVLDHEGDGAPGFTVKVDVWLMPTVAIYLTQANHTFLEGELVSPDRVVGRPMVSRLEQHVIGASHSAFGRSPIVRPLNDEGSFQLVRVPTGTRCEDIQGLLADGDP